MKSRLSSFQSLIQTRYCYVYAYSEEAIFKTSGYGGEVIFFDSKDKCDVKGVFGLSKQEPGKCVVTVSHEDDDWYEVFGTNSYIKTSSCLSLALGEEAYLTISPSGFGRLRFDDGDDCVVEGIYTKLRLRNGDEEPWLLLTTNKKETPWASPASRHSSRM